MGCQPRKQVPFPEEQYGQFYSGDSFLVLYEYTPPGKTKKAWMLYVQPTPPYYAHIRTTTQHNTNPF